MPYLKLRIFLFTFWIHLDIW